MKGLGTSHLPGWRDRLDLHPAREDPEDPERLGDVHTAAGDRRQVDPTGPGMWQLELAVRSHVAQPKTEPGYVGTNVLTPLSGSLRWRLLKLLYGGLDVSAIGLHGLHIQPPFSNQAIAHDEDRDPTHREKRPVHVVTVPVPLAPFDLSVHR